MPARVALIGPEIEENLSLRYIAATLARAGHEAEILAFNHEGDFGKVLSAIAGRREGVCAWPDVVGISLAFQWRARDFLALAMALREAGFRGHVTVGGHFATFASREILTDFVEVDSVCRQEAEETMVRLVDALDPLASGRDWRVIPGLAFRADDGQVVLTPHASVPDLATLPWPDRRGAPATSFGHGIAPLVSSRGCYANCSFCCIAAWHEESLPGVRYRLRDVADVADEMVALKKDRGVDIFVFHDDNFFVPGHKRNLERFHALADALSARGRGRGIGAFATVVKARPTDCHPDVLRVLKERLHCIRMYVGIETDADQGLRTLRRWAKPRQNHDAIERLRALDMYACFNMLVFDPDTTVESLETNIRFIRDAAEFPSNFGRVELYAGTPLLARMQAEGRTRGDYLEWDYALASPEIERIFGLAMDAFYTRNFGDGAVVYQVMALRADIEVARHFHHAVFDPRWLEEGKELTRVLANDTASGLQAIVEHVRRCDSESGSDSADREFVASLAGRLRATERVVDERSREIARSISCALGRNDALTDLGDRIATPLQTPRTAGHEALHG